jgi:hypothetical protein
MHIKESLETLRIPDSHETDTDYILTMKKYLLDEIHFLTNKIKLQPVG